MIARHGREVELLTYSNIGKSYDPVRHESSNTPVLAVFVDPTTYYNTARLTEEDRSLIQDVAKLVFISAFTVVTEGMRIREKIVEKTVGSTPLEYSITNVLDAWPGQINVINKVLVKL